MVQFSSVIITYSWNRRLDKDGNDEDKDKHKHKPCLDLDKDDLHLQPEHSLTTLVAFVAGRLQSCASCAKSIASSTQPHLGPLDRHKVYSKLASCSSMKLPTMPIMHNTMSLTAVAPNRYLQAQLNLHLGFLQACNRAEEL